LPKPPWTAGGLQEAGAPAAIQQTLSQPFQPAVGDGAFPTSPAGTLPAARAIARQASRSISIPWRSLLALTLALLAQNAMEPRPDRSWQTGVFLYGLALFWLVIAVWRREWADPRSDVQVETLARPAPTLLRHPYALVIALLLALVAFISFGGNHFSSFNITLLALALALFLWAFWQPGSSSEGWIARARASIARPSWNLMVTPWTLVVLAAGALVIFFRVYHLAGVPPEMISDHAEKLLDVSDVLQGKTSIFFTRNTGREAIQMYLTAGIARLFGTGLSFISLKIGTVLAGLLTLPFITCSVKRSGTGGRACWR
jgi:hypothetical protein